MKIKNYEDSNIVKFALIVNDVLLVCLSYWLAFAFHYGWEAAVGFPVMLRGILVICCLTVFPTSYFVPPVFFRRFVHGDDILSRSALAVTLQTVLILATLSLTRRNPFSLTCVFSGALIYFVLLYAERVLLHYYIKYVRARGRNARYVVLVGNPLSLSGVYNTLNEHSMGFNILGIFTRYDLPEDMRIANLGDRRSVLNYLRHHPQVTDLYLVPDVEFTAETEDIFRYCEEHLIHFYVLPVFLDFLTKRMELSHFGSTMLLSVRNEPLQDPVNRGVKRLFDILVSGIFLLTVFPICYLVVAIIIKIQSRGPVFFCQKRNGLNGREFVCLKFRSMHINDDADRIQCSEHDARKFRFGDFMRRTNIDEFPQFINVFKGDMSLVGPRPHMLLHTEEYSRLIKHYMLRHLVKPGITGWAQVNGLRGETRTVDMMEARVRADIWYVENWSFSLDLRIIWGTFRDMVLRRNKNAY